jgi:uncharacterized membrane protein YhfC
MNTLTVTYLLNGFLMIAMPIGLTIFLTRRFKQGWRLFWIGAATFIISQVLHIPFNALVTPIFSKFGFIALPLTIQYIILSTILGLSAGLFEELSRYVMYRLWAKDARSWGAGLIAGAGHGGIEAIILGIIVLYGYIQMLTVRGMDISTLVTADKVELAEAQIQAYWSSPWYMTLLGALERLFTIPLHLACSVLVLQAFIRNKFWWVGLAILFHAMADGLAVFASQNGVPALEIEGIIGIMAIISVVIIFLVRTPAPPPNAILLPTPAMGFEPGVIEETNENLGKTRYQ